MTDFGDILKDFLVESYENLDQLDQDLVALESDPDDADRLASVFRTLHTIKGSAGFFGFEKLQAVAHAGENLLSRLRDGQMRLTPDINDLLLATADAIRTMLQTIEESGSDGENSYSELLRKLEEAYQAAPSSGGEASVAGEAPANTQSVEVSEAAPAPEDSTAPAEQPASPPDSSEGKGVRPTEGSARPVAENQPRKSSGKASHVSDSTIRVDVALLDKLMNLVGELVLARNQIVQFANTQSDPAFLNASQRLSLVTTELQEGVMKTRMQPIATIWNKLPRVVRDLARQCGKQVRLELHGKEVELDKSILETIKDPLTHLIRNAVDHGIESPEERTAAGKPAEGTLSLRAYHEGGQVNIEISDDGRGIDIDKVRRKAIERGLLTPDAAATAPDHQILQFIFHPGLSTAEKVTNVSGRGVGMDVVKTHIEKIGGSIEISTERGRGTTFRIKLPLTLAIIPALIVRTGGERMAIPQVSLLELVRVDPRDGKDRIEWVHNAPVYRLRGELLPIVYLSQVLGLEDNVRRSSDSVAYLVVLHAEGRRFGLVVDEIVDTQEIVVKPLARQLKHIPVFAGATIMGDGKVALILDAFGLARKVGLKGNGNATAAAPTRGSTGSNSRTVTVLLVALGPDKRAVIPLRFVSRLEDIAPGAFETAGEHTVIQYGDRLLPIVDLVRYGSGAASLSEREKAPVVVCNDGHRQVGLLVDRIVDIVEAEIRLHPLADDPIAAGAAVICGKVADVIDVERLFTSLPFDPTPVAA